jgi:hypothetical protein
LGYCSFPLQPESRPCARGVSAPTRSARGVCLKSSKPTSILSVATGSRTAGASCRGSLRWKGHWQAGRRGAQAANRDRPPEALSGASQCRMTIPHQDRVRLRRGHAGQRVAFHEPSVPQHAHEHEMRTGLPQGFEPDLGASRVWRKAEIYDFGSTPSGHNEVESRTARPPDRVGESRVD